MYDNYNYPIGSDSPNAPWNQYETPERDFNVSMTITLTKEMCLTTSDYKPECDDARSPIYPNTEYTDWSKAYARCYYTIPELLADLKQRAQEEIKHVPPHSHRHIHLKRIIDSCEGFNVDQEYFEEC